MAQNASARLHADRCSARRVARATAGGAGNTAGGSYAEEHTTQLSEKTSRDVMYIKTKHGKPATSKKGAGAPSAAPAAGSSCRRSGQLQSTRCRPSSEDWITLVSSTMALPR